MTREEIGIRSTWNMKSHKRHILQRWTFMGEVGNEIFYNYLLI
ncbi:hypothetical protein AQUSIP_22740 [Aquicella siphonis]|uniref:Uncharacterized protein n=1 Tax=Aquicella siphonis TaxID=254247 RepID=A0A5E4PKK9_9COXI|nr:hypothetical protein AQUSIP_22740 [Aquicella siphonis]